MDGYAAGCAQCYAPTVICTKPFPGEKLGEGAFGTADRRPQQQQLRERERERSLSLSSPLPPSPSPPPPSTSPLPLTLPLPLPILLLAVMVLVLFVVPSQPRRIPFGSCPGAWRPQHFGLVPQVFSTFLFADIRCKSDESCCRSHVVYMSTHAVPRICLRVDCIQVGVGTHERSCIGVHSRVNVSDEDTCCQDRLPLPYARQPQQCGAAGGQDDRQGGDGQGGALSNGRIAPPMPSPPPVSPAG